MQINKLNIIPNPIKPKVVSINKRQYLNAPIQDTVVFKGNNKHIQKPVNSNTEAAVQLADRLLQVPMNEDLSLKLIEQIVHEQSPDVKVCDISNLAFQMPDYENYGAFFNCQLGENFNIVNKRIYINTRKANRNPQSRLSVINDIAHEYTHAKQMDEGQILGILKASTNNDIEYSKAVQGIGDFVFKPIDTELQAKAVLNVFYNPFDIMSNMKFGFFYPREQNVTKQDILNGLGLKNEKEFKSLVLRQFDEAYDKGYSLAMSTPDVAKMIPKSSNYNKLRNKVKAYCAHSALKEKEAYTTESMVSKKYLKTDKPLNIDIFPIYYKMVADALS